MNQYTPVYDAAGCISALQSGEWDYVFLDHDLGGKQMVSIDAEDTGSAVCRWIYVNLDIHKKCKNTLFYVHTLNSDGAINMLGLLKSSNITGIRIPFTFMSDTLMNDFFEKIRVPVEVSTPEK